MDYGKRISQLLDLCQNSWVTLQSQSKELPSLDGKRVSSLALQHAGKELHNGIKRLVQLQDAVDENPDIVNDEQWRQKTEIVLEQVRKQLQEAIKCISAAHDEREEQHQEQQRELSPLPRISEDSISADNCSTSSQPFYTHTSTSSSSSVPSVLLVPETTKTASTTSSMSSRIPEEDDSNSLFNRPRNPAVHDHKLAQALYDMSLNEPSKPSSAALSLLPPPPESPRKTVSTVERPFGRKSITVENEDPRSSRKLRMLPVFSRLKPTRSTPLPSNAPAQINFYKDDEESKDRREIFASDAIVDQPLRIGVGYGSYICYNCTVLSDKGPAISVRKRYSDFVDLRDELIRRYPRLKNSIPKLPPKKVVGKFTPAFVEQRRRDLEYFFKYIVLHPTLGTSSTVTQWIAP